MNVLFADTFYWIAYLNADDEMHTRALEITEGFRGVIVTTQWVLAELLDGFSDQPSRARAAEFVKMLQGQTDVSIVGASTEGFTRGLELYHQRPDKEWSLTDCISFLVMSERGVVEALTADHHFEQAGFVALLK